MVLVVLGIVALWMLFTGQLGQVYPADRGSLPDRAAVHPVKEEESNCQGTIYSSLMVIPVAAEKVLPWPFQRTRTWWPVHLGGFERGTQDGRQTGSAEGRIGQNDLDTNPMLSAFELASLLLVLCALFGFINRAFLHLPNAIGLLLLGVLASLLLVSIGLLFPAVALYSDIEQTLRQIDFAQVVFNGVLAFLLFAGALNVDFRALRQRALAVAYLAIVGTVISTALIGVLFWIGCSWIGVPVPLSWAIVFGALISPTDPVGVITLLKGVRLPASLKVEAEGEALLNDGVGVVLFTLLVSTAAGTEQLNIASLAWDFVREAGGGVLLGLAAGYVAYRAMRRIDDFPIEVLITLALVTGTYALAQRLGVSGPIATVAAGLLVGYRAPQDAMSETTQGYVSALWTLIDEVLNSVLFLLIGLEVFALNGRTSFAIVATLAIPIVLISRFVAVALPLLLPLRQGVSLHRISFLTWAGIHGGISVALALALPASPAKAPIVAATYAVVLFSIIAQGLTLDRVARLLGLETTIEPE